MRQKHKNILTIFVASVLLNVAVAGIATAQNLHTYQLDWYPGDDASCSAAATEIGARFKEITGHHVLAAACQRTFSWKLDVVIQYQAPAPVKLVSTRSEFASSQGTFQTREACEAELENEKELFTLETGLHVVVAYCYPESSLSSENRFPFVSRVDGFGMPRVRPFVFTASLYQKPDFKADHLEDMIAASLEQIESVKNPRLRADFTGSLPRLVVKYYSTRQRALALESIASFERTELCESQRTIIDGLLSEFGVVGTASYCAREQFSEVTRHYYFGLVAGAFKTVIVPGTFANRSHCESALPGLLANYQAAFPAANVKVLCSFERPEIFGNHAFLAKVLVTE